MSLASILNIARSALLAHQRAMTVTSNNVANAQTPGYSRQRLELIPATPLFTGQGTIGRGVSEGGIRRARDQFFDATFRRESGLLGQANLMRDFLGQVEATLDEPSDTGLASTLNALFQSFGDLGNNPSSAPERDLVRQAAGRLVQQLHRLDSEITQVGRDATQRMQAEITEVNSIVSRIADLNSSIIAAGGPQHSAPDLEDQRDVLIDRLSSLVAVRVLPHDDGTIGVLAGNALLVERGTAQQLSMTSLAGGGYGISMGGTAVDPRGGSLGALSELVTTTLPALRTKLDDMTRAMVTEFNATHRTGTTLGGATGTDFFDPTRLTAGTISLTAAIQASGSAIAASGTGAPGDGAVALQLAAIGNRAIAGLGGNTLREYYIGIASGIGLDVRDASQDAATEQTLVDRAEIQRSSVSGVSIEEEMALLIGQQQAYAAAARLINVAQEMVDEMLRMI